LDADPHLNADDAVVQTMLDLSKTISSSIDSHIMVRSQYSAREIPQMLHPHKHVISQHM
jgi:hypothetical protein